MTFYGHKFGHRRLKGSLGHRSFHLIWTGLIPLSLPECAPVTLELWMEKPCGYSQDGGLPIPGSSTRTHRQHGFFSFRFNFWSAPDSHGQNVAQRGPLLLAQPRPVHTSPKEAILISASWYPSKVSWCAFSF